MRRNSGWNFGGAGDDLITGAAENDFLIGGEGIDRIIGSAGHDILVAGDVADSFTNSQLRAVLAEWAIDKAPDDGLGEEMLDEGILDENYDMLTGSSGADWFIISDGDKITDFKKVNKDGDVVTTV